ncbi:Rhs family protein, partial [Acidovorax sp. CF316]|uniref:RHS repeat protein n=1 Tax=Acidovorax sp. CF316 TaxID=1144317 RepID=UPI00026BE5A7
MPLEFRRIYRSHRARDKKVWFGTYFKKSAIQDTLGDGWLHNHDIYLATAKANDSTQIHSRSGQESGVDVGSGFGIVRIHMGDGTFNYFHRMNGDSAFVGRNKLHTLVKEGNLWVFEDAENERRYVFSDKGLLAEQVYRNGWRLNYFYDSRSRLGSVSNSFGQTLEFAYGAEDKLLRVTSNDQRSVSFTYTDAGALKTVRQADGTTSEYVYTDSTPTVGSLLAGRIDENASRYTTFKYDLEGWALSTEKAGGVDKYTVPAANSFVDPLGTSRSYRFNVYGNELVFVGSSWGPLFPDERPVNSRSVSADALVQTEYDQRYTKTNYTWDIPRRLPITINEAVDKPEARTTNIIWHPQWRSPSTVTVPGRGVVNYTYDGSGNVLTQTEVGATGTNTWTWTYHPSGLVATEKAPNGATTSYQYDAAGNLTTATNALGHVDTYTHDTTGRVLTHTAPNGLVTAYVYDPRGNVLTLNRGGLVTTFTYRPSGEVDTATLPHGHRITYSYDGAHRLVGWSDNRGASASYVLDGIGNRTTEEVRGTDGQLVWKLVRTISQFNRLASSTTGDSGTPVTYWNDHNGDRYFSSQVISGSTHSTTLELDPLRRVKSIVNAENATASLTYNGADAVTQAKDFKGVATDYTRDFQGNATAEASPDSGNTSAQYDALGLPSSITNALGQATTITRDLLGRPTSIVHTGGTTTLRYDQSAISKGYLSEIEDASGTTTYQRDVHGRVVSQTQKLINNDTRTLAYSYNATTGLLSSTTYPGGQTLQNVYDATGQLTGLTWAGQPIVSGITWSPLGQPTGWSWNLRGASVAIPATRTYNTAGQLTNTEFSSYIYDAAGRITSLTQSLMQPASTDAQASTVTLAPAMWTVTYNRAGRITGFTKQVAAGNAANTVTYAYDANGNRTTSSQQSAGTTTNRTYALTANRQTG